ncbi:hypothetical protein MRX96_025110 [Rhipicephalus microplus]
MTKIDTSLLSDLQYKKKYETLDDLKTLRYGHLMMMTDQDQDDSHINCLLINFIHHNWPSLLKLPFLEEFITPIVKASRGSNELSFYSLPEFEEWKTITDDWLRWKVKYHKGLSTSTSKEANEYFTDMLGHRITFRYQGNEDDHAIELAFSKKMIEQRKDWLHSGMEERKQRCEMGLPELYLYGKDKRNVTYLDFVNKELFLFSNMDNERSIPSLVDGLKPGQRKVLFTCFKAINKREIKVAQMAESVAEHSAYHHGEASLMSTIINLTQNFVGSNNVILLQPIGQFSTRLQGGKDMASPLYIFTMLSLVARLIIPTLDNPVLEYLYDENQRIEPEYYIPVLPMVLVNGAERIGTGWSTKMPNHNPRDIVANLRRMTSGDEPNILKPWFKYFCGSIDQAVASNKAESETKPTAFAERVVQKVEWEAKAKTTGARRGAAKKATSDAAVDGHGDVGDGNAATLTSFTSPGGLEQGTESAPTKAPLRKQGGATKDTSSMTKTKSKKGKKSPSGSDSSGNDEPPNSVGSEDDLEPVAGPSHRQQCEAPQRAHSRKKLGAAAKTKQRDTIGDEGDTDFVKPPAKKLGAVSRAHKKAPADDSESDPMSALKKATNKMRVLSSSSSADDDDVPAVPCSSPANGGRSRAVPVKYYLKSESSDGL